MLLSLFLFGPLGFGELVEKCDCSRGALNRALTELYDDKLVEKEPGRVGRRYCLTKKGRGKALPLLIVDRGYAAFQTDDPKKIKSAFAQIKKIIEAAEGLPDSDVPGFLSCIGDIHGITGFYSFKPEKRKEDGNFGSKETAKSRSSKRSYPVFSADT